MDKTIGKFRIIPKVLGQGMFATCQKNVQAYNEDQPDVELAVKIISKIKLKQDPSFLETLNRIEQEIETLKSVNNEYIVKIIDSAQTDNNIYIFLEFCNNGNLEAYRKSNGGTLPESEVIFIMNQFKQAFQELYKKNIIHRDIKPENILRHNNKIKIADFGFAKVLQDMQTRVAMTTLGTPYYSAMYIYLNLTYCIREILQRSAYSSKCDVFSIGIIIYQLLFGIHPFLNNAQVQIFVDSNNSSFQTNIILKELSKYISNLNSVSLNLLKFKIKIQKIFFQV